MSIEAAFPEWFAHARELGFREFRLPERQFKFCALTGKVLPEAAAVGLYYWVAQDGEVYAGKTIQGRRRLLQHLKRHGDLACVAMRPANLAKLDQLESNLIAAAQSRFPTSTRNIKLALNTSSDVPFDTVISEQERTRFLTSCSAPDTVAWRALPLLEQKNDRRAAPIVSGADAHELLLALSIFIDRCLPKPAATEARFWSVSALYSSDYLVRLNVGQQEVFTLHRARTGKLVVRLFAKQRLGLCASLFPFYQMRSYCHTLDAAILKEWLTEKRVLKIRELVVQLMRHTTPLNIGSHCPALVRAAFEAGARHSYVERNQP